MEINDFINEMKSLNDITYLAFREVPDYIHVGCDIQGIARTKVDAFIEQLNTNEDFHRIAFNLCLSFMAIYNKKMQAYNEQRTLQKK